jgi:hypothetical protein
VVAFQARREEETGHPVDDGYQQLDWFQEMILLKETPMNNMTNAVRTTFAAVEQKSTQSAVGNADDRLLCHHADYNVFR